MNQPSKSGRTPLKTVACVLAVLVVALYVAAVLQIVESAKGPEYEYDARDYQYSAAYDQFGRLYDTAVQDMGRQAAYSAEVEEYRALAFYYEQAVLEHAYRVAGEAEKANEFAARMSENEAHLGSLSDKAAAVRESVGS